MTWTAEERLRAIETMASYALDRMNHGERYSAIGSPNFTSILHVARLPAEILNAEEVAESIETMRRSLPPRPGS